MKAYFYCRVAHDDSFSLERQAEELRRYAEQAGYTIVGAAAEHGSGMTLDRPALQEVMEAVLAGKVDVVLISSLDRIGRDWGMTKQYIDLLTEQIEAHYRRIRNDLGFVTAELVKNAVKGVGQKPLTLLALFRCRVLQTNRRGSHERNLY